jgi:branched-chain amino acid transport system ATP-binding protein
MLTLDNVHTYYGDSHILQGVSLEVGAGQVVSLLGRNGAGKTTTINTIVGFTPLRSGTITFKGHDISRAAPHTIARLGMGLVPQGRRIFPNLSVRENITLAARPASRADRAPWTLDRIYQTFPILRARADHWGSQLSGGEQQMLAIARALATNPDLLLLDEPSEGLAPLIVAEIGRIIATLKQQGLSILLVEQHVAMAMSVADMVYVMNKGQIVFAGDSGALQADEGLRQKYLGVG